MLIEVGFWNRLLVLSVDRTSRDFYRFDFAAKVALSPWI